MVAALHGVIVLVGGRGGRHRRCGYDDSGGGGRRGCGRGRRWRRRGVAGAGGIALGGSVVFCVGVVNEGDVGLRVFYPEFWMGHEVVDGGSGLWLLQTLIEGDGAAECIHHSDLEGKQERQWGKIKDTELVTFGNKNIF